jgi:hypothetical protein
MKGRPGRHERAWDDMKERGTTKITGSTTQTGRAARPGRVGQERAVLSGGLDFKLTPAVYAARPGRIKVNYLFKPTRQPEQVIYRPVFYFTCG